jgi:hypothetical protein
MAVAEIFFILLPKRFVKAIDKKLAQAEGYLPAVHEGEAILSEPR